VQVINVCNFKRLVRKSVGTSTSESKSLCERNFQNFFQFMHSDRNGAFCGFSYIFNFHLIVIVYFWSCKQDGTVNVDNLTDVAFCYFIQFVFLYVMCIPCSPVDSILRLMTVRRKTGKIIRTVIFDTYAQLLLAVLTILGFRRFFVFCVS